MSNTYRRVRIRLSKGEMNLLSSSAYFNKIPKAKLLKQWLKTSQFTKPFTIESNKQCSFNFRIKEEDYKDVFTNATTLGITISDYIRTIIRLNTRNKNKDQNYNIHQTSQSLFERGYLNEYVNLFNKYYDVLSFNELFRIARYASIIGNYKVAASGIDFFEDTLKSNDSLFLKGLIHLLHAELSFNRGQIGSANQHSLLAIQTGEKLNNSNIIGLGIKRLGDIASVHENVEGAITFFEKALDLITDDLDKIEVISSIANKYFYKNDLTQSNKYLNLIIELNNRNESLIAKKILNDSLSKYTLLFKNDIGKAKHHLKKSIQYSKESQTTINDYYYYRRLGRILIAENEYDSALQNLYISQEKELQYRESINLNYSRLYIAHIVSQHNYHEAMRMIEKGKVLKERKLKPNVWQYVKCSTQYIFGETEQERELGYIGLKELEGVGHSNAVRRTAKHALRYKQFAMFF